MKYPHHTEADKRVYPSNYLKTTAKYVILGNSALLTTQKHSVSLAEADKINSISPEPKYAVWPIPAKYKQLPEVTAAKPTTTISPDP